MDAQPKTDRITMAVILGEVFEPWPDNLNERLFVSLSPIEEIIA